MKWLNIAVLALAAWPRPAGAQEPVRLALVVGSNRPGPGQELLRFAYADALRFAEVLAELGGYPREQIRLLQDPGRAELRSALEEATRRLETERARGNRALFTFFYSGHARSGALSLGAEEIPLDELRESLLGTKADVILAVLDACQAGAISGVKGAEPAADFSFNSVSLLSATGVAIMSSSTAGELSQESPSLGASYFTHHLVVGLRGAADVDRDGRVTLSEAYRYAYHRTLAETATTAVGRQHVTLENDLKGRGEMVLTFPERSSSRLVFPEQLAAELLVERQPAGAIVAEVEKTAGNRFDLALPPGEYSVLLRLPGELRRCELVLAADAAVEVQSDRCRTVPEEEVAVKGDVDSREGSWGLELGVGFLHGRSDAYNRRLTDFGFEEQLMLFYPVAEANLTWNFNRNLALVLRFLMLEQDSYRRDTSDPDGERFQDFSWENYGLGLFARGQLPLFSGWLVPYLEAGGGIALAVTHYSDEKLEINQTERFTGWQVGCAAGVNIMPWRHFGFFGQVNYTYAPAITNLMGDEHDGGGFALVLGLRGAL